MPLSGDRGNDIRGSSMGWSCGKKVVEERKHWRKQRVTSCNSLSGRLEFPPFTASAAAQAEQSCQQAPHYTSSQCPMVKAMQVLPGSHCLHSSFRTPRKAQGPGKNVALDGPSWICPPFLSEYFPAVCSLLITDWEFSKTDQQCSSLSGSSSPIFPLWTVHLLFLYSVLSYKNTFPQICKSIFRIFLPCTIMRKLYFPDHLGIYWRTRVSAQTLEIFTGSYPFCPIF